MVYQTNQWIYSNYIINTTSMDVSKNTQNTSQFIAIGLGKTMKFTMGHSGKTNLRLAHLFLEIDSLSLRGEAGETGEMLLQQLDRNGKSPKKNA